MTDQTTQPIGVISPERVKEILEELHAADPVRYPITPPKPSLAERVKVRLDAELRDSPFDAPVAAAISRIVVRLITEEERPWPSR